MTKKYYLGDFSEENTTTEAVYTTQPVGPEKQPIALMSTYEEDQYSSDEYNQEQYNDEYTPSMIEKTSTEESVNSETPVQTAIVTAVSASAGNTDDVSEKSETTTVTEEKKSKAPLVLGLGALFGAYYLFKD